MKAEKNKKKSNLFKIVIETNITNYYFLTKLSIYIYE